MVASLQLTGILGAVAWAFCFAASGLFFPLVLGIWWKRANRPGAIAGMVFGFVAGSAYLYYVRTGGTPWLGSTICASPSSACRSAWWPWSWSA
jgi:cation/acetate symporter